MSIRVSETILLLFPKEGSGDAMKVFFDTQEASIKAAMETNEYRKVELTKAACLEHTATEHGDTEVVAYGSTTLNDAWSAVVDGIEAKSVSHQTWFVLW